MFVRAFLTGAIGLALGLWLSALALSNGGLFDFVNLGPWRIAVHAGSLVVDPYVRASVERSGAMPLAVGEGLELIARSDDDGRPLDPRCAYRIGPHVPAARYWTLSLVDDEGLPVDNPAGRYGYRSTELLRAGNGDFAIIASATVSPGDWLPIGAPKPFALVLRLYDSPLAATAADIERTAAPRIQRIACS
jgi:hypothetical protein